MKTGTMVAAVLVAAVGVVATGTARAADRVVLDSTALRERLEAALKSLESLDAAAAKTKGKAKKAIRESALTAREELEAALEVLGSAEPATAPAKVKSSPVSKEVLVYRTGTGLEPVPHAGAPAGAVVLRPYGAKKLETLVREIKLRTTLEEKRELISRRVEKYYFNCGEAEAILRAFDFDKDRAMVAEILWPVIVDPTNFGRVIEVIGSAKQQKKLMAAIGWTR